MGLTDEDVREILRIIDESELDELRIDMPGFRLHVRRGAAAEAEPATAPPSERGPATEPGPPTEPGPASEPTANGAATIEAPMLGTFYRASAPGQRPYVEVGSRVEPDTVVCLIEVMKMMNSVKAGLAGTVVEVCATNAELVEYGEPLFRVDTQRPLTQVRTPSGGR
jgi:acetyl-CoA carboxylase biotin carboxyl carrier protein